METSDLLATFAVRRAGELLTHYAGPGPCTTERWHRVLAGEHRNQRSVVPRSVPAIPDTPVLTFRTDSEPFGQLVDAASRLVHDGGREAAHQTAEAARTVKVLTTVPRLRYHRPSPLAADASGEERFWHRVDTDGNGFLPVMVHDLTAAVEGLLPDRSLLPNPAPPDPDAWVVVWTHLSAPALVLSGVWAATTYADESGTAWLVRSLRDAAQAMKPDPGALEWKDPH